MILLKVSGVWPNLEVFGGRVVALALVELVEILADCIEENLAILSVMFCCVFMQMATISNWCLVRL